ncbi:MAG: 3-deoxy-D-manno-octulosonic acid transferase [Flavobacteriales bacterium]|nr:3-deoxy-D-manno-octulosonic acid transferase [Flavobacteriales bacterium]
MRFFYNFLVHISTFIVWIAQFFSSKLKLFVAGRRNVFAILESNVLPEDKTIWMHCASLGEYEQGLPVLKEIKKKFPLHKIILTFFSPSGYEIKKNTAEADVVCYLPIDTISNARKFIALSHPELAMFVKYEFWPNYLHELKQQKVRTILISGLFRKSQLFFKPYGGWMRNSISVFEHFFVQNEDSEIMLQNIGFENVTISGDTRFDRVSQQILHNNNLPFIDAFKEKSLCLVAGSTWKEDEDLLIAFINSSSNNTKFIIAPHNIKVPDIQKLKKRITKSTVLYSEKEGKNLNEYQVFIIDTIGFLTRVYSYADIAYVGGAMGATGLHNILEPATFGVPIVIGKNFENFPEAERLLQRAGLFSVSNFTELKNILDKLISNTSFREKTGMICGHFISNNTGATSIIIKHLKKN